MPNSNIKVCAPTVIENDVNYLIVEGEHFRLDFDKHDGYLCKYEINGRQLLNEGSKLTPNFGELQLIMIWEPDCKKVCSLEKYRDLSE